MHWKVGCNTITNMPKRLVASSLPYSSISSKAFVNQTGWLYTEVELQSSNGTANLFIGDFFDWIVFTKIGNVRKR
jgi:hypothetical protein